MTDITTPADTDPTSTGTRDVPEPASTGTPEAPATEVHPRRRVRIDHLRRAVVETRTNPAYRWTVRHGSYIAGGTRVLTRRAWDARTTARHERFMRIAEASGNEEMVTKWEQRAYAFRFARHKRRMDILQMLLNAPKAIASAVLSAGSV
ncbi:cell division protein FtsK, partial [Streptomyces sp. ActVer]|nr:cell division protein FtsK [Streptomyces sp. ActVer]